MKSEKPEVVAINMESIMYRILHNIFVPFFHYTGLQKGLPSVKKYNAMAKALDPIKAAGQKGDSSKAKDAYKKVKTC